MPDYTLPGTGIEGNFSPGHAPRTRALAVELVKVAQEEGALTLDGFHHAHPEVNPTPIVLFFGETNDPGLHSIAVVYASGSVNPNWAQSLPAGLAPGMTAEQHEARMAGMPTSNPADLR